MRDDRRVALTDTRGLHYHQVEPGGPAGGDGVVQAIGQLADRSPGRERPEKDAAVGESISLDGVHPDPVTEEGAPTLTAGRVNGENGDAQLVFLIEAESADQLVGQGRLAGPARSGDAEHGRPVVCGRSPDGVAGRLFEKSGFRGRHGPGQGPLVSAKKGFDLRPDGRSEIVVALDYQLVDHLGQAHFLSILGRENAGHAVVLEQRDFRRDNGPPTAAVHPDVASPGGRQPVHQILEVLDVASLVGADGNALHVLLDGCGDDLVDRSVVAQVDHFGPLGLEQPAHYVDGGVVTVEQAGRRHEPHGVLGPVQRRSCFRSGHATHNTRTSN